MNTYKLITVSLFKKHDFEHVLTCQMSAISSTLRSNRSNQPPTILHVFATHCSDSWQTKSTAYRSGLHLRWAVASVAAAAAASRRRHHGTAMLY